MVHEWTRGPYAISTERGRLDLDVIHGFLARSYWAQSRSRERVAFAIDHSVPFGLYHREKQIGFAPPSQALASVRLHNEHIGQESNHNV